MIRNHLNNVDLYINDYLNYYEITLMEDGVTGVEMFLWIGLLENVLGLVNQVLEQLLQV